MLARVVVRGVIACASISLQACHMSGAHTAFVDGAGGPLAAMAEGYANCRTYQDTGTVSRRLEDGSTVQVTLMTFETAFDRANGEFRFDFTFTHPPLPNGAVLPPDHGVIWLRSGKAAHAWWTVQPRVEERDVSSAIESFAGVTGGAVRRVPPMLLGLAARPYRDLVFLPDGEEVIHGEPCARLSAHLADTDVALWISARDHTLRRIVDRRRSVQDSVGLGAAGSETPFTSEFTIEYSPALNTALGAGRFDFSPPNP
jgi:hypothetical protein